MRTFILFLVLSFISPAISFSQISFERKYGGERWDDGHSVQQTTDGGYVITGYTESFGSGSGDVYLIRTDSLGDTLWTRRYGGEFNDRGWAVQQTSDDGFVIAGDWNCPESFIYLIKTDSSGDSLWTRLYTDTLGAVRSILQTADGGYVIAGVTKSSGTENPDVYLIKTNSDGYVGISDDEHLSPVLPRSWGLSQNYPNPFNPTTTISFDVPGTSGAKQQVQLSVFDARGRQVIRLIDSDLEPGSHRIVWDGKNEQGQQVPSGIYLYRLRSGDNVNTRKMILLK